MNDSHLPLRIAIAAARIISVWMHAQNHPSNLLVVAGNENKRGKKKRKENGTKCQYSLFRNVYQVYITITIVHFVLVYEGIHEETIFDAIHQRRAAAALVQKQQRLHFILMAIHMYICAHINIAVITIVVIVVPLQIPVVQIIAIAKT